MDAEAGSRSMSFEGLERIWESDAPQRPPISECVPLPSFTPESGALVAVLSDLFNDGYARRDTFFDLQSVSLACPYMIIMLKYQSVCSVEF